MSVNKEKHLLPSPETLPKYDVPSLVNSLLGNGVALTFNNGLSATLYSLFNTKLDGLAKALQNLGFAANSDRIIAEVTIKDETIHLIYRCDTNPWWLIRTALTSIDETFDQVLAVSFNGKLLFDKDKKAIVLAYVVKLKIKPSIAILLQQPFE